MFETAPPTTSLPALHPDSTLTWPNENGNAHCDRTQQNQAVKDVGFFVLINHGVPRELIKEVWAQMKAFFELPMKEKMNTQADKNNRGYRGMYEEAVDRDHQYKGDTKVNKARIHKGKK